MARKKATAQEAQEKKVLTRAQKTDATKAIVNELLAGKATRHNELIEEVAKVYALRYEGTDTENPNDVKGRVGSVLDIMKKDGDIAYEGGTYALKALAPLPAEEKAEKKSPAKKSSKAKKEETTEKEASVPVAEKTEEAPAPKKRGRPKKATAESAKEPPAPAQEKAETPAEKKEEKPAPKKRVRAKKEKKTEEKIEASARTGTPLVDSKEEKATETEEKRELAVLPKAELAPKSPVMDMSFLFGVNPQKPAPQKTEKKEETPAQAKVEKKAPSKVEEKAETRIRPRAPMRATKPARPLTEDEKLRESFLKRMRTLSGEYFEYYSVYLLQRYSMKNGRRLESMKISGGDRDGGIDGEIELTDKLGFRETIYIQSKNWDPEKGREDNWVVGETLLQQFIGACACRQAKDGKQHARGIFITTSRFTPDAKKILEDMSEKIVGYDGEDLYDAAKECSFGVVKKNGKWELDENLLAGTKAFFQMF